ncbi:hypothetical protein CKA32_001164 [Geitlerinema sp. FC II]|nr:hypothetical protein [Geitlerinema sp. CS-897]PPT10751.1 hypothetical protein CKA32_001164 [Geitlerinema sp. FC II]
MQQTLQKANAEVGDYFDLGWTIFKENISTFATFTLVINLPLIVISQFIPQPETPEGTIEFTSSNITILVVFYILAIVLGTMSALATHIVSERAVLRQSIDAKTALQLAVPKIAITVVVSLVASLIIGVGTVLLVVPGIYLAVNLAFIGQAIALRDCGFDAFQYSRNLVKGQWWKVFGRFLIIGIGFFIIFIVLGFIVGFLVGIFAAFPIVQLVLNVLLSLVIALAGYFMSVVYTMLFLNLDYVRNAPTPEVAA